MLDILTTLANVRTELMEQLRVENVRMKSLGASWTKRRDILMAKVRATNEAIEREQASGK